MANQNNSSNSNLNSNFRGVHTIITHNGVFHCDDGVGTALLLLLNKEAKVVRTRDKEAIQKGMEEESCIVFDVGLGQYDHHGPRAENDCMGVPFCGLTRMWWDGLKDNIFPIREDNDNAFAQDLFYKEVLVPIALQDNGHEVPCGTPNLFQWVHSWNPQWDQPSSPEDFDKAFMECVEAAKTQLLTLIPVYWSKASAQRVLSSLPTEEEIVEIPAGLPGWQSVLGSSGNKAKFVLFPGTPDTPWYLQCVPNLPEGIFSKKIPFPASVAGKSPEDAERMSGVSGWVFCHAGGFIAGFKTRDEARRAAEWILSK